MKSSTGLYFSRLDHVRALAAFMVFFWHFTHVFVPFGHVPVLPPLSLFEEGHIGVGLFMTLSGYLFAKVTAGRDLDLARFYLNRLLRLAPLLLLVLLYWYAKGRFTAADILPGLVFGGWPGGTWSIVVELHFYLVFPLLLWWQRRHPVRPLALVLAAALLVRTAIWLAGGNVQDAAYWTIVGCIDFFVIGIMAAEFSRRFELRAAAAPLLFLSVVLAIAAAHAFNLAGGFYGTRENLGWLWIIIPTLQAILFAGLILGYEALPVRIPGWIDRPLARIGEVSYSIYLLHFIVFTALAKQLAALGLPMADFTTS
ncbi:MAG: hypothetical protein RLZ98_2464, partial [Pseudomonadota bacterium]